MTIVRHIHRGDRNYPRNVARLLADGAPGVVHVLGDACVPSRVDLALICSVSCPGSVIIRTYDVIRDLCDAGVVVAGGFHSPMERECLHFLIRGTQPVVFSPARLPVELPVARPEDVLAGKVWAAQDPAQRASKRQKDLADIARLLEAFPALRPGVPPAILDRLV